MTHFSVTAHDDRPLIHGTAKCPRPHLARALDASPGPVIISIHGYRYAPGHARHCPHASLLSLHPRQNGLRTISWPRHLGFGRNDPEEGLSVGFGWQARNGFRQGYRDAEVAGRALARLVDDIATLDPARPIQFFAHSLGARVALRALRHARWGRVGRVILMAGAAYASETENLPDTTEILNVTTRENDVFDLLFETAIRAPMQGDRALGHGLDAANMLNLQLDQPATLEALESLGFRIAPPARRVCHWSPYLRGGVFPLYRALLRSPETLPLATLRACLPQSADPHWSRLFQPFPIRLPLPFPRQTT